MADYNGDLSAYSKPLFRARVDNRLAVAAVLLVTLGFTGAHRFYLGHMRHAYLHLGMCFVAIFFGLFSFKFELALTVFVIQGVILAGEFVFMLIGAAMTD